MDRSDIDAEQKKWWEMGRGEGKKEETGYLGIQIDIMGPDNINIETEITKFNLTLLTALYRPHSQIRKNDKNENN